MATDQVPLLSYVEEMRSLISNERNEEALALAKHVLHYFPKHVDTYLLAAQASLESGDDASALELFRRGLGADPENFVAYTGLAIIFDHEHRPDETIWHLERANEITPANLEIRKELFRAYGEVEDQPRTRLKLTSGGLARLYVQEGLFAQAIQEFRAIVDADPNRFDARVALAETLWHAGKIREAADVALHVLDPLPYCLKANLILGATYHETGLPEAETYLRRAQEVDPANDIAQKMFGTRSPLPLANPLVPRYVAGAPPPDEIQPTETEKSKFDFAPTESKPAELISEAEKNSVADSGLPAWLRADFREMAQPASGRTPARPMIKPTLGLTSALPPWLTELQKTLGEPELAATTDETREGLKSTEESAPPAWAIAPPAEGKKENASDETPDWLRAFRDRVEPNAAEEPISEEQSPIELKEILPTFQEPAPEIAPPIIEETPKPKRKRQPRGYSHLLLAREHRNANRIDEALVEYDYVVQHGPKLLNEAIDDLKELIAMWGAPLDAHRILGDAFTRADRLAEALDEYRYVLERVSKS
ncbi:MAG: tetratricopeptide repeat protein [Chloroflexi bacterium]|nr:tetratricopeptide repeat protein [Chloroflexota bacterium]